MGLLREAAMPLVVSCPSCNTKFHVADEYAEKRGKCPKCGSEILIAAPLASAMRLAPREATPRVRPSLGRLSGLSGGSER